MITDPKTIEERMSICNGCDKSKDMSSDPLYSFVDFFGKLIPDANKTMCEECLCPIWVKVRVPAKSCPLDKWKK
jgi:hypothetical protein